MVPEGQPRAASSTRTPFLVPGLPSARRGHVRQSLAASMGMSPLRRRAGSPAMQGTSSRRRNGRVSRTLNSTMRVR
ncbi:hypothetical protein C8T65DRAFT_665171 [Cerioporus squamosus]|nr:hypothetical protein C8T65DRAFT_665171 [Cerioporus squamosus]